MKTNIILLVISILCLTNNSCELESKVYDSINASTYPKTENDVDALVTEAAYGAFRNDAYDGIFNVANGINILSDLTSDYSECTWRDRSPLLYGRWTFPWQMARIYGYSNWISKMELTADRIKDVSLYFCKVPSCTFFSNSSVSNNTLPPMYRGCRIFRLTQLFTVISDTLKRLQMSFLVKYFLL
jgi:hypothetical protein